MATFADEPLIYDHELYVDWAGWDDDWTCAQERDAWRDVASLVFYAIVCWLAVYGVCNIVGWRL